MEFSVAAMAQLQDLGGRTRDSIALQIRRAEYAAASTHTPYGDIIKLLALPTHGHTKTTHLKYACPFATMSLACASSPDAWSFFRHHLRPCETDAQIAAEAQPRDGNARVAIYMDGVVPGNNLRPDKGRTYVAIYWTFLELPEWFRVQESGWCMFAHVPQNQVDEVDGKISKIAECVLRTFWPGEHSAEALPGTPRFDFHRTGMRLAHTAAHGALEFHFRAKFA